MVEINYGLEMENDIKNEEENVSEISFEDLFFLVVKLNSNPASIANSLNKMESVLVVSAGNQGLKYVNSPATWATAEDSNGNLLMGGKMLIAGGWDSARKDVHRASNKAGHICIKVTAVGCDDKYRTSQFYIMAPMWTYGANKRSNGCNSGCSR